MRITLLVNIWLGHKPKDIPMLDRRVAKALREMREAARRDAPLSSAVRTISNDGNRLLRQHAKWSTGSPVSPSDGGEVKWYPMRGIGGSCSVGVPLPSPLKANADLSPETSDLLIEFDPAYQPEIRTCKTTSSRVAMEFNDSEDEL